MPSPSTQTYRFANVILPLNLPQTLTYGIPEEMQGILHTGMRVEVGLGRNRQYAAVIESLHNDKPDSYQIKPIRSILDEEPVIYEQQLVFWKWIAQYYISAPGEVMQAALPAHLKLMGETRLIWQEEGNNIDWDEICIQAIEVFRQKKEITISELRSLTGNRNLNVVIHELLEKEAVLIDDALEHAYRPRKEKIVSLSALYRNEQKLEALFEELGNAPKQLQLIMAYVELAYRDQPVRQHDLLERSGAQTAQIKALADKGVFEIEERAVDRLMFHTRKTPEEIILTAVQQKALDQLNAAMDRKPVCLIEGVTGSGKTLLYIQKIRDCIASGKQVIFMVPEIGLTTQLVNRLYSYFGDELGVYHSRFSNNERVEIWEKVKKRQYKIVVGPRSVLWLPYNEVGLVIVDEEHDVSYKQKDPAPRFHGRDAAIFLASLYKAHTILGSATPSVESLYNAAQDKYGYVLLSERYQGVRLPSVELINAKSTEAMRSRNIRLITPELSEAMLAALQQSKQTILFQNRRGYAPFQLCTVCGWVPHCKNCAVSLTYHKSSDKLHCHYCGLKSAPIHTCPSCGSNRLRSKTYGTERIEEEVRQLFPEARVARMDVDSMRGKRALGDLLDKLEKQKVDVLVGTQMVVKGLDFSNVTLVGILSADNLLGYPDFRVNERAFQLMTQVSGRAGRTDGSGKVLIQAYNTTHPVLQWVLQHDVRKYYDQEISYRSMFGYPPFSRLIRIIFKHRDNVKALNAATELVMALQSLEGTTVQGPVPALVSKVRNLFIQEVWLKCPRDMQSLQKIKTFLKHHKQLITARKGYSGLQILFDVDPV